MWRILGNSASLCDRQSRRELLRVGGLSTLGLMLPAWLRSRDSHAALSATTPGGTARRCIMLYMWGGPAHQDTWDLKPEGPAEFRGEFKPIDTVAPGIQISEHFPRLARHTDKMALVRSVTHADNNHSTSAHAMLTGRPHRLSRENFGPSPDDFPHIGSVVSKLRPSRRGLPSFVALPEQISTTNGPKVPGQGGGLLGKRYDPFTVDQHPDEKDFAVPSLRLPSGLDLARVSGRQSLLEHVDAALAGWDDAREVAARDAYNRQAIEMISSPQAQRAFQLDEESPAARERYGMHTFGQSCLLARRLIEAGVGLVTVYWHRDKPGVDTTWDTHANNFPGLKDRLMPLADEAFSALLADLAERGLLDDTLVVWTSEFGRTPKINANGGRDHWGRANSVVFAGGGVTGGQIYGATDPTAGEPTRDAVSPQDLGATIYTLLGIDPRTHIYDALDRPYQLSPGTAIAPLL
ncbi:MAG: DUF1501 domain-containing protein [Pirellulales bacterium]|nr:DUF1501 domain-containing protein [Planctomycetales bacterium]